MTRSGRVYQPVAGRGKPWAFVVDVAPPGAPRRQVRRSGFATKAAAQAALTNILYEAPRAGNSFAPTRDSLGDLLKRWLAGLEGRLEVTTLVNYAGAIRRYVLADEIASIRVDQLTPAHLNAHYRKLQQRPSFKRPQGLSNRTVLMLHTIISKALTDAVRRGELLHNPARAAQPPRPKDARAPDVEIWTPVEMRGFLNAAVGRRFYEAFLLACHTGMRRGEILGLSWAEVDLDARTLWVQRQVTTAGGRMLVKPVKTDRSRRRIDLHEDVVTALSKLRDAQVAHFGEPPAAVFCNIYGGFVHPSAIDTAYRDVIKAAGLRHVKMHGLRHAHATYLLEAGVNPKTVANRLGHASVAFTLDRYAQALPTAQANAAASFGDLLAGPDEPS